jgi:DNA polymerase III alpha subunit
MFVPLHVKSDYSIGYGTASVDELVAKAAALGYRAVALTDLENLYGQVRFHRQCRLHGIRPITGVELRPGFDPRVGPGSRAGRVILLAMDFNGYNSLCRIVGRRRGGIGEHRGDPPAELAARNGAGIHALSDDVSALEALLEAGFPRQRMGLMVVRPHRPTSKSRGSRPPGGWAYRR